MDRTAYCRKMDTELTAWKVKIFQVIGRMNQLPVGDKEKIYENVNGALVLLAEIDNRINALRTHCPGEWSRQADKINLTMADLVQQFTSAEQAVDDCLRGRGPRS